MDNIIVRLVDLDPRVKGFVRSDCNGDYNIYINSLLCVEAQRETLEHELEHIRRRHVYSEELVRVMEQEIGEREHFPEVRKMVY